MHPELGRLFDAQGGVVTSAQALTFLSRRELGTHLDVGALQRVWRGIYGRGEPTAALRLRGLDLAVGLRVAACMGTAAAAYGFDTERGTELHVLNPGGRRLRSTDGLVVHRRAGAPMAVIAGRHATAPAAGARNAGRRTAQPRVRSRGTGGGGRPAGRPAGHRDRT